jgi:TetR/AcrR family transcriptional regulator, regulator of mycofactocin system
MPALQAHSVLRYGEWREVIAEFVVARTESKSDDLLPRTVAHVSFALALSSYEEWLASPDASVTAILNEAMPELREYLDVN